MRPYEDVGEGDLAVKKGLNEETTDAVTICLERREVVAAALADSGRELLGRRNSSLRVTGTPYNCGISKQANSQHRSASPPQTPITGLNDW
jgi:hypothetical protein